MLIVIQSGQTGVERGAHRGAIAAGIRVAGFSTLDERDELGSLPQTVAERLTPCFERGSRQPILANIALASVLLIVVPDARGAHKTTGIGVTLSTARALSLPYRIVDPSTDVGEFLLWTRNLPETSGSARLMVTGPRQTRWADGEKVAWQFIAAIGLG